MIHKFSIYIGSCDEQVELFNTIVVGLMNDFLQVTVVSTAPDEHPWITDVFKHIINIRHFHFFPKWKHDIIQIFLKQIK